MFFNYEKDYLITVYFIFLNTYSQDDYDKTILFSISLCISQLYFEFQIYGMGINKN